MHLFIQLQIESFESELFHLKQSTMSVTKTYDARDELKNAFPHTTKNILTSRKMNKKYLC